MRLERIHLENFRQHAETEVELPPEGIVGLVGQNESGKSTVLEAIVWALYGTRATRGTKDSLRWNRAPARHVATVTLDFMVGGTRYRVDRSEHDATLTERESEKVVAEGTSGVDARVPELVGMTLEEFTATYLCRQKDLDRLRSMGGTERRQFVLSVMGMDRIDEALSACRDRKNSLRSELQGMREGLGDREPLEQELEAAHEHRSQVEEQKESADHAVSTSRAEFSEARDALESSREEMERHQELSRQARQAQQEATEAGKEMERVESALEEARGARETFQERRNEVADLPDLRQERDDLREARARAKERESLQEMVDEATDKVQFITDCVNDLSARVEELREGDPREKLEQARQRSSETKERYQSLQDHDKVAAIRLHLESGEPCPVCEHRVEQVPDASEALERLEAATQAHQDALDREMALGGEVQKLEKAEKDLAEAKKRRAAAEEERTRRVEKLEALDVPSFNATRLAQVEGEIERLEEIEEELRALKAKVERIPELEAEVERWSEKATAAKARELEAREELEALEFDAGRHADLEEAHQEAEKRYREARERAARLEEKVEAAEARVQRAVSALESYDERAEELAAVESDYQTHVQADERLADFRAAMAASIRPELEELVSGFLSLLTDGRHEAVRLTEDFEVVVHETGGEVEVISGGAQDITAIAMRLAISQLIAERAGHPLSLLVLDEPFGSLDAVRRENVLSLIRRLRGVFSQVLLITHVEEIQDTVDHVLRVEYDEAAGRSRVTEELSPSLEAVS